MDFLPFPFLPHCPHNLQVLIWILLSKLFPSIPLLVDHLFTLAPHEHVHHLFKLILGVVEVSIDCDEDGEAVVNTETCYDLFSTSGLKHVKAIHISQLEKMEILLFVQVT